MPIHLCAGITGFDGLLAPQPESHYWLDSAAPESLPMDRRSKAKAMINWRQWLAAAARVDGLLVVAVEAAALDVAEQAMLAAALATAARAGQAIGFAPAAVSLAGQTIGAPAHDSCLPAVVFATGAMDASVALSAGLLDAANRHRRVLMLDGDVCIACAYEGGSLQVTGAGTLLVAAGRRGDASPGNATIDVLTDGMQYTFG